MGKQEEKLAGGRKIGATAEEYLASCLYTANTPLKYLRYGCYGMIGVPLTRWLDGYLT